MINSIAGSSFKSASYESWTPSYTTATLTWRSEGNFLRKRVYHLKLNDRIVVCRANGSSVSGSISTPSDEPQGGNYRISNCGNGCHVLMRLDQTKFGDI